jgi:hypothetical protein
MHEFWEHKRRQKQFAMYCFAPFIELAGTLLIAASKTWHAWSLRRTKELKGCGYDIHDTARHLRECGTAAVLALCTDTSAFITSLPSWKRSISNELDLPPHPEATHILVNASANLLLTLLPHLEEAERTEYSRRVNKEKFCGAIETLMESPCIGNYVPLDPEAIRTLAACAMFLECQGLAVTQGHAEDGFNRKAGRTKKKKSTLSNDALRDLAEELGVDFDTLKEVFETEHSSWWDTSKEFGVKAQGEKKKFIDSMCSNAETARIVHEVWDFGSAYHESPPEFFAESQLTSSENTVKLLISFFSSFEKLGVEKSARFERGSRKLLPVS